MFLSKDFIDETLNVGRKEGQRGEGIYYQLKPKIRLAIIYFCYQLDPRRSLPCNTDMHEHMYIRTQHTHTRTSHYTQPTSPLFYPFLPVYISVVIFGCAHCCQPTNCFRWYISLNSSTCSCPPTLTFQARSFCDLLSRETILSQ